MFVEQLESINLRNLHLDSKLFVLTKTHLLYTLQTHFDYISLNDVFIRIVTIK